MKKFLLPLLLVLSQAPCHATWFFGSKEPSHLEQCLGATTLLLGTLCKLDDIHHSESIINNLKGLKKDLQGKKEAQDLYEAIDNNDYKKALQLLKNNPNLPINARFTEHKLTSLMKCCCHGDESVEIVRNILKHPKFDITIKNNHGTTCLSYACDWGTPKITKLLLERPKLDKVLNETSNQGSTPLDYVVWQVKNSQANIKHMTVWNMLVAKGGVLNKEKDTYKQLKASDYQEPHSLYVKAIKSTPPQDMIIHLLQQSTIEKQQEGMIKDTNRREGKEDE